MYKQKTKPLLPVCERLWKAAFAEGGEVQGVWFLVHSASLDVQVFEYVHFAFQTNLNHKHRRQKEMHPYIH